MKRVTLTAAGSRLAFFAIVVTTLGLAPQAQAQQVGDLEILKLRLNTLPEPTLNQGDTVVWRIRLRNLGPDSTLDALVEDDFDDTMLENVSWVCVPSTAPTNCPGAPTNTGSGDILSPVILNINESCVCDVTATIRDCVIGDLVNTATITAFAPDSDPDTSDNSSTVTESLIVTTNLAVFKDDARDTIELGDHTVYQIDVTNNGPDCHPAVSLLDVFPNDLENIDWTCDGAQCPVANGVGDISETFQLADGESVTFTADADLTEDTTADELVNTALLAEVDGITDPNLENNESTDTDLIAGAAVPTLPETALIGLALALVALGVRRLRRPSLS
jgi:uncharacterized repeat protein (TIGR01451 family)